MSLRLSSVRQLHGQVRHQARARRARRLWVLEGLEERTLLTTETWINPAGGDWDTASNWSTGSVPGPADDAVINIPNITVTHSTSAEDTVDSITSQATLNLSSGSLSIHATSSIAGGLMISAGTLSTVGKLTISGSMSWTGGTISGAGTLAAQNGLALGDPNTNADEYLSGITLDNAGAATLSANTLNEGLVLTNGAVFDNQPGASLTIQTNIRVLGDGTGTFINAGSLTQVQSVPAVTAIDPTFNQTSTGSTLIQGGGLLLRGGGAITGPITAAAGTTLEFGAGATYNLDASSTLTSPTVIFAGDRFTDAGAYDVSGSTRVTSGSTVTFNATITNLGNDLEVDNSTLSIATSQSFSFTSLGINGGSLSGLGSGNLTVTGSLTWVGGSISGFGTVSVPSQAALTLGDASNSLNEELIGIILDNAGTATWAGGSVFFTNGAVFNNLTSATFQDLGQGKYFGSSDGNGDLALAPSAFNNAGAYVKTGTGRGAVQTAFNNTGTVTVQAGLLDLSAITANVGSVQVSSGGTLSVNNYTQTAGDTTLSGGTLSGGPININGGSLAGSGTISGNLINAGQVIPGSTGAAGLLVINGNYAQTTAGRLDVEIGGTTAGSQYSQLAVSGTASLDGTLSIATINGFLPALGNAFQVLTFASATGNVAAYNGLGLGNCLILNPTLNSNNLTLTVQAGHPPVVGAISGPLGPVAPGIPIRVSASFTDQDTFETHTALWNWGDGTTLAGTVTESGGSGSVTGAHVYAVAGVYALTVTVTDSDGCTGQSSFQVTIAPSILVLSPTAPGALTLSGNASINIPGAVVVASTSSTALSASGNAQLSASAIDVLGGFAKTGNATFSPAPTTGVSMPDPLAGLASPSTIDLTNDGSVNLTGGSQTISQGIYAQIKVSGSGRLSLNPGIYIIEGGGLTVTGNASIAGSGVTIYNAGSNYPNSGGSFGGITLSGNGTFSLSAPTTGTYAGILIFQSRQNTRALSFSGNAMAGMSGTIYAANALLSMSGNASLQNPLIVGMLNLSGNVSLTQIAVGSDGTGDSSGIANTLLAGNLTVYINDPSGNFTADELARIQDAINAWDAILATDNVTITEVSDPTLANLVIDTSTTSACGGVANGVLGCYNEAGSEITMLQGWNWYAGADPSRIGSGQYDFETTVLHELGHALGLGGSTDPNSPMYETLAPGGVARTVTTQDLNIPDPPAGADPLTAAGLAPASAPLVLAPNGFAAAPSSAPNLSMAGLMPLPPAGAPSSSSGRWPVVRDQANAQVGPGSSLVAQGMDPGDEHGSIPWIRPEPTGLWLPLDSPRLPAEPSTQPTVNPQVDWEHPAIRTDREDQPVSIPAVVRVDRLIDSVLDELAFDPALGRGRKGDRSGTGFQPVAAIPTGKMPMPRSNSAGQPTGSSARPAEILLAVGFLSAGAGLVDVRNLGSKRPTPKRTPPVSGRLPAARRRRDR